MDSILLLEEGFSVTSVDASDKMLKYAKKTRWNRRKEPAFDKWGLFILILKSQSVFVRSYSPLHSCPFRPFISFDTSNLKGRTTLPENGRFRGHSLYFKGHYPVKRQSRDQFT